MNKKVLCIYHGFCDDGFAAAWCVRNALGANNVEFYPGVYQKKPPDCSDRDVLMVDFSYKRPVINSLIQSGDINQALTLLILDHHKTAMEDLAGISQPEPMKVKGKNDYDPYYWRAKWENDMLWPVRAVFDMERSGAGLTWDFFHPYEPRPSFINYIEDRDLWRKQLPGGDEFTIALRSYPQDFDVWDALIAAGPERLIEEGKHIQRYYRLRVEELKRSAYEARFVELPHKVRIANAPYFAASEVAGELATDDVDFGACYFEVRPGEWQYSLRSRTDFDVSAVAKLYGGGGHKASAGFSTTQPIHTPVR